MQHYTVDFFVVAITAAVVGFGDGNGTAAWIAEVMFVVFLFLAVVGFLKKLRLADIHDAGRRKAEGVICSSDPRMH